MMQTPDAPQRPVGGTIGIPTDNRVASPVFMAEQRDPRLQYKRHRANIGPNAYFNACLPRAQGQYLLLLDDDDVLDPTFMTRAMVAMLQREPGLALAGSQ